MFKRKKYFGIIAPDYKDIRDYKLSSIQKSEEILPNNFILIGDMPSIQSQYWGSCTSHAVDGVKEYQEKIEYGKELKLSNRFIYYNTKVISGLWNDQGDYIRNALKAVQTYGVPTEEEFPDTRDGSWTNYMKKKPSGANYEQALIHKSGNYFRVDNNINAFKQACYINQTPLVTGMLWHKNYKPDNTGLLQLPDLTQPAGGHAISYVGWTIGKEWFRNSWGTNHGKDGYFYIPTSEFSNHIFWDAWVLLDLPNIVADNKIGFVAQKYIDLEHKFSPGQTVKPTTRVLNMRLTPNGDIVDKFLESDSAVIIDDPLNGILKDGYRWWKIKKN